MQKETPNAVDLEETAELPVVPGAAAKAPPPVPVATASAVAAATAAAANSAPPAEDPLAATDSYHAAALRSAADGDPERTLIWRNDPAAEQNLELGLREAEIGALRSDLASVTESRGQLESNLGK